MKKFKDFEQILNDSLRNESKIVEMSIDKLALEVSKARLQSKRASKEENALMRAQKLQLSPEFTEQETEVDEQAKKAKSNDVDSVEQKHRDIWQLMDKKNIFIDSSKASEVPAVSRSPQEKAVALPQSE